MKIYSAVLIIIIILGANLAQAERLAVSAGVANVRSGPGTEYEILWKVEKYHPIFVIEKTDSWYHFRDFEGDKGWLHDSLVSKIKTIITKGEVNNIRSGPGTKFKILFKVEKGIPFKVLTRKEGWIHIQHADGDKGWIHASLVW
ncbi:MAG: SH3 domain-containing protein [Desulfobacterales bacterium]|jgi:SH3-like domain-containing protein